MRSRADATRASCSVVVTRSKIAPHRYIATYRDATLRNSVRSLDARARMGSAQPIGVPMAGIEKSTARVIAVLALLFVTAWALRGYLPGVEPAGDRTRPASNPAALIVDIALVSISVGIIVFAIVARLRNRQVRRPGPTSLPEGRGAMGRPTWRLSLVALAVVIAWVLLVMVLSRLGLGTAGDHS